MTDDHDLDLVGLPSPEDLDVEQLTSGNALAAAGTLGTTSTASTASCPISSATCVMTASSAVSAV